MAYYSQFGQDKFINELLLKKKGTYIDIGAYDGKINSNTLFFEELGWSGLLIEPNLKAFNELKQNRSDINIFFNNAISDERKKLIFVAIDGYCEQLSGLKCKYNYKHWERTIREVKENKCKIKEIEIDCLTFNGLIGNLNINYCDLLSIDTEGSEIDILKNIDWNKFNCKIICAENPYGFDLSTILPPRFKLIKRLECDDIYIMED